MRFPRMRLFGFDFGFHRFGYCWKVFELPSRSIYSRGDRKELVWWRWWRFFVTWERKKNAAKAKKALQNHTWPNSSMEVSHPETRPRNGVGDCLGSSRPYQKRRQSPDCMEMVLQRKDDVSCVDDGGQDASKGGIGAGELTTASIQNASLMFAWAQAFGGPQDGEWVTVPMTCAPERIWMPRRPDPNLGARPAGYELKPSQTHYCEYILTKKSTYQFVGYRMDDGIIVGGNG